MLVVQAYRIRSAFVFAVVLSMLLMSAAWNEVRRMRDRSTGRVGFLTVYVVPLVVSMFLAVEAVTAVSPQVPDVSLIARPSTSSRP